MSPTRRPTLNAALRVVAIVTLATLVATLLFTTIDSARSRRESASTAQAAIQRASDTAARASRRIDLLTADIKTQQSIVESCRAEQAASSARSDAQIAVLESQLRQLGARPVVPAPTTTATTTQVPATPSTTQTTVQNAAVTTTTTKGETK